MNRFWVSSRAKEFGIYPHKELQLLMTEIYKTRSGLSPPFMKDIFAVRNTGYDLRQGNDLQLPKVHTTTYGIETISFLGNRLWSNLPNIIKQANNFQKPY